jgi:hypothetical protein
MNDWYFDLLNIAIINKYLTTDKNKLIDRQQKTTYHLLVNKTNWL